MAVVIGTNSYGDETGLQAYADDRGITITGDLTQLLIKAMDWVEIQSYKWQKYDAGQSLQFPRSSTYYDVDAGTVPPEVITAQYVAALLVDSGEDLNPVVGRAKKMTDVYQAVKTEFMDNANETSMYPQLTQLLSRWLLSSGGSFTVTRA